MFVFWNQFLPFLRTKFGKFSSTSKRKNFLFSLVSIAQIVQVFLALLSVLFELTDDQTATSSGYFLSAWKACNSLTPCVSPFCKKEIEIVLVITILRLWQEILLPFIRTSFGNFPFTIKRKNFLPLLVSIVIFPAALLRLPFQLTDDQPITFSYCILSRGKYCKSPCVSLFCLKVFEILTLMIILATLVLLLTFREKIVVLVLQKNDKDFYRLFQLLLKSRANFPELPDDVISKISNRLTSFEDFVALSGVCRPWRSACLNMRCGPRHQFPWLMLSERENRSTKSFYSAGRNKLYELELPQAHGKRCHGSPHGWIVTMDRDLLAHLLHPLSQAQLSLPQLNTLRNQKDEFLVMVIFGPKHSLAFAKPGFVGWTTVVSADGFKDILLFKGQIHAICGKGRLLRFSSDDPESTPRFIAYHPEDVSRVERIYLLESSGKLLVVFRFSFSTPFEQRYETKRFLVYMLHPAIDGNLGTWLRLNHLGDWALFVGEGNSWSICTAKIPICRSNCIYLTDNNWDQQVRGEEQTLVGHDIGVFDMESKKIERLELGPHSPCYHSRSVWFTPSLVPYKNCQA